MMKSICVLLLLVVAVFGVLEEKKAQVLWAGVASLWENPNLNKIFDAYEVIDGNPDTIIHSNLNPPQQPYLLFSLNNYPFFTTYVDVINRNNACGDNCRYRVNPFTVFLAAGQNNLGNGSVEYLKQYPAYQNRWRTTYGTAYSYRVPFPNIATLFARLQQHQLDYLNLAEVSFVQLYRPPYLGYASSSQYADLSWNPKLANDSNPNTWFHSDDETNSHPWLELQFGAQKICRVAIWNRAESCCSSRILPFTIALKNGAFTTTGRSLTLRDQTCAESGVTCSARQTGPVTDYYEIDFSSEPVADRVRIIQENPTWMNVAEVQAYACSFPADFHYEV